MANGWSFSVGNAIARSPNVPVAATGTEAADYPFSRWGDAHSDEPGGWEHETAGIYEADFDLNQLAITTSSAAAPLGWFDLLNLLVGTPGLPANPPERSTFLTRADTVKVYRPSAQDFLVMPGETMRLLFGIAIETASAATNVAVYLQDLATGLFYNGGTNAWTADGVVASQATDDTWLDVDESVAPHANRFEPSVYRMSIVPGGGSYSSSTYVLCSDPAVVPLCDVIALIGHNVPVGASLVFDAGTPTWTFSSIAAPLARYKASSAAAVRNWTLTVTIDPDIAPFAAPPKIGEVWVGKERDFISCPLLDVDVEHFDPSQIRVEGGRGRISGWADGPSSLRQLRLKFAARSTGYQQERDEVYHGSRRGIDPILLIGDNYEAGMTLYGRIDEGIRFSREGPNRFEYVRNMYQEPLWTGEQGINTRATA